jgi:hypothetical protein
LDSAFDRMARLGTHVCRRIGCAIWCSRRAHPKQVPVEDSTSAQDGGTPLPRHAAGTARFRADVVTNEKAAEIEPIKSAIASRSQGPAQAAAGVVPGVGSIESRHHRPRCSASSLPKTSNSRRRGPMHLLSFGRIFGHRTRRRRPGALVQRALLPPVRTPRSIYAPGVRIVQKGR